MKDLFYFAIMAFVIWLFVNWMKEKLSIDGSKENVRNNMYSTSIEDVSKDFANEAIKFFDNYLCLCKNHSVMAVCSLLAVGQDEFGIKTKAECVITAIDGEHGDETFDMVKRVWSQLIQEKIGEDDNTNATRAGAGYIKEYFGCEDLHYTFLNADEYVLENGQAIIFYERTMFTTSGAKWQPTLYFIKQELQKKWANAKIDIGEGGIIVKQ